MTDPATARHIKLVETLTDCAGNLAVVAHDMAIALRMRPDDFLALSAESRHCGFAARMGVKLSQALRAGTLPARAAAPLRAEAPAPEPADAPPASERPECERREREHESESDPAPSLPLFLQTLRGVAANAERRTTDARAKLTALLADAGRDLAGLDRPKPAPSGRSTRAQLMGTAGALRRDSG